MSSVVPPDSTPFVTGFPAVTTRVIYGQWVYTDGSAVDTPPTIEYVGGPYFDTVTQATLFTKKQTASMATPSVGGGSSTGGVWWAEVIVHTDSLLGDVSIKISHPVLPGGSFVIAVPAGTGPLNVANALVVTGSPGGLLVVSGPKGDKGDKGDPGTGGGSTINDTTASGTTVYSSTRTEVLLSAKADLAALNAKADASALAAKADLASVVTLSTAQSVTGVKTFTASPVVPTPTTATQAAPKGYVDTAVAGVTGGTGSSTSVDASSATYAGGMSPTKTAVQNGAALQAAIIAANGKTVTWPAGEYPCSGVALTDQHINISAYGSYLLQPQGADPIMTVERTPAAPIAVGSTYLTWWGPWNPSGVTVSGLLQAIPATGLNRFKGGRVYHISSRDIYPWAWSAQNLTNPDGSSNYAAKSDGLAFQAEQFPLLGIGVVVSTLQNGGPLESMMVQGSTSGAQGLIQSRLVGNANGGITATQSHITFTSVTGDFVDGENLVRITGGNPTATGTVATVGQVVGVVTGAPVLLTTDIFVLQYGRTTQAQATTAGLNSPTPVRTDNTVQLREIDTKPLFRIRGLGIDVVGAREDPDTYVASDSRYDAIQLRGVYAPDVEWRVRNSWTRAMCAWSVYMGTFSGFVDQMPNHAILNQSAFAYGLELKSGSKANRITLQGHTVRHLFTTNPNERSWALANLFQSGKWTQWDYGTPIRNEIHDFVVEAAFAPGMDTHPGDYYTTFRDGHIYGGGSGGRYNTDNNSGMSTRGFGTKFINVDIHRSPVGINIGGIEHDAGISHRYLLQNVHIDGALAQGVYCYNAMVPGQATIEIDGGTYGMALTYPDSAGVTQQLGTSRYYQALVQVGDGVNLVVRGEPAFRKFTGTWLLKKGTGTVTVYSAAVDYTECPAGATGLRVEAGAGLAATIKVYEMKVEGNPSTILRNVSGNSAWLLGDIQWLGTGTQPSLFLTSAGTPTYTQTPPLTNASTGGTTTAGTQVSVDGVAVSTLDISSTPSVQVLSTDVDIAGPAAGANVANLSAFQTALPVGTYIIRASLQYQVSAGTSGALRFGLGGTTISGASITNVMSMQFSSLTAPNLVVLNALVAGGAAAVTTAGSANVAGVSPGVFATTLFWTIEGKITVTSAGTYGLVWQMSTGADRIGTLKAGSSMIISKAS